MFCAHGSSCWRPRAVRRVTAYPATAIHVVLDNLNTHKPKNDQWLKRHRNVRFHFTPTRASWLNQVEIWFSILQGKSLHGASFTSVQQLRDHIDAFIKAYNENAGPFVWTKAKVHQRLVILSTSRNLIGKPASSLTSSATAAMAARALPQICREQVRLTRQPAPPRYRAAKRGEVRCRYGQ